MDKSPILLDCTFRDGGYYNNWDFDRDLIENYLSAMQAVNVDFIEIGFRGLKNNEFNGALAYSSENFLESIEIPLGLKEKIGVMINGSEISDPESQIDNLKSLFTRKENSVVTLVRIACHVEEFVACLPAATWLKDQGYVVGFNLMQVAGRKLSDITALGLIASDYPIDVLYFADSMGSLNPSQVDKIVKAFQKGWKGALGIHTHDNMGYAIANTLQAIKSGVSWVDSTVTGMGRGPGNAQTEYLINALSDDTHKQGNPIKLFALIRNYFKSLQAQYGWGTNHYYFLSGKFGIHPSYIQLMLRDNRYNEEDILAVIEYLRLEGGRKFNKATLESAMLFYSKESIGSWEPANTIAGKSVLIIGTGPGIKKYKSAIEAFIQKSDVYTIALNTQSEVRQDLVDARAACHPLRLLADFSEYLEYPQPLITPASMLPNKIREKLKDKELLDFGINLANKGFKFNKNSCEVPMSLVIAYALAVATSGKAKNIYLAGFDGYPSGDPRNEEAEFIFSQYRKDEGSLPIISITPTKYQLKTQSLFGPF